MATTVKFNPQTGKALKKGEKVTVNGKTFTEGSSNIYGDTVKTTNANKSTGSESVKAQQRYLNSLGANLKVDGIAGPLTKAAQSKYGSASKGGTAVAGMSKPGQNMTYASSLPTFTYSKPSPKSKTAVGGFLSKIGSSFKDAISTAPKNTLGANALYATVGDNMTKEQEEKALETISNSGSGLPSNKIAQTLASGGLAGAAKVVQQLADSVGTFGTASADEYIYQPEPEVQDTISYSSLNPDLTGTGNIYSSPETDEPITSGTTDKSLTLDNPEMESLDMANKTFSTGANPAILNNINMANNNFGVNSSSLNNPWEIKTNKSEFQNADMIKYADTTAKGFTSPEEAMKYFNTAQGLASVKPFLDKGGKVEDIMKRIQPVTTGVVGPQTFQEFEQRLKDLDPTNQAILNEYANSKLTGFNAQGIDTKNVPAELKGIVDAQNKQLVMKSNFLNEQQKMLYEQATQDKLAAQEERNALQQIADARETAIERKTDILTKQYKADMKAEESETEMNRITARKNLTEFLAQIGALRTDGNAQLGIETLDQRYQAQKSAIRSKYMTLISNAQAEADEKISDLQYNLKMNTLELYKDLNKTDREIRMETMKMRYDYESDVLSYNTKYQEKLMDLKEKQKSDALKLNDDWRNAYFTLSAGDMFASLPIEFRNQWLQNNQISPEGFKTTQPDLAKDFGNWSKNKANTFELTSAKEFELQKQGVDIQAYKTDAEYRAAVNSKLD